MELKIKNRKRFYSLTSASIILILFLIFIPSTGSAVSTQSNPPEITKTRLSQTDASWNLAIYGDKVVWSEDWVEESNIKIYNLSTHEITEIAVDNSSWYCDIYGDTIVWDNCRDENKWDIYAYNLSTSEKTQLTFDELEQTKPSIYGDRVVYCEWENGTGDIYMYNLSTRKESQITTNESIQRDPVIYGDRVVWQDARNGGSLDQYGDFVGNWDIYMYNLSTQQETQITSNKSYQIWPAIYEDRIVWQDARNGGNFGDWGATGNWDIYMYNLSNSKETKISSSMRAYWPAVFGNRIAWIDNRTGNEYRDLYLYDLSTSQETLIASNESFDYMPSLYGNRIVWISEIDNNSLYMTEFGPRSLTADFTAFPSSGNSPLEVTFTDKSKGNPFEWNWDFGDGTNSTEQNPEHTYSTAGNYTVKLTATSAHEIDTNTSEIKVSAPVKTPAGFNFLIFLMLVLYLCKRPSNK